MLDWVRAFRRNRDTQAHEYELDDYSYRNGFEDGVRHAVQVLGAEDAWRDGHNEDGDCIEVESECV